MRTDLVWLYCSAARPDLFDKAMRTSADAIVFDLEDSVLPEMKDRAREMLSEYLGELAPLGATGPRILVRTNEVDSPWFSEDLAFLESATNVAGVRLPKVAHPDEVSVIADGLGDCEVHVSVETPRGLRRLDEICEDPKIDTVTLGEADLRSALCLSGEQALDIIRVQLVCALAAGGKRPPMGSVFMNVRDDAGLIEHSRHLQALGFLGRTAIHPVQIETILRAFMPTPVDVEQAQEIVNAAESAGSQRGSIAFTMPDGRFVDVPVVSGAKEVLALAGSIRNRLGFELKVKDRQ